MSTTPAKAQEPENKPLVIILLGAPGSGKGTQAVQISKHFNLPHISTGDLLRDNIRRGTDLGKQAQSYMEKGQLGPDELILDILFDRIAQPDCKKGYILDGFPRNSAQAHELEDSLRGKAQFAVFNLSVNDDIVVKRLSGRLTCKACNSIFHKDSNPPKVEGVCDKCGGKLYQRPDDNEAVIKERLRVYHEQTKPLVEFYRKQNLLTDVDASGQPDTVLHLLVAEISKMLHE
ncbi:MAG TPA: adenylate kinase [Chlamydiales bacterium]|nr:adenylate kinase [Chlamydiales bacterium]